jgi:hypothetical protein
MLVTSRLFEKLSERDQFRGLQVMQVLIFVASTFRFVREGLFGRRFVVLFHKGGGCTGI